MPKYQNLLGGQNYKNTPLYASLYGLKQTLSKHCSVDDIPIISHDDYKAYARHNEPQTEGPEQIKFPYGYLVMSSLALIRDSTPVKHIKRMANTIVVDDQGFQDATIHKGFLFPARFQFEFNLFMNDIQRMCFTAEKLLILSAIDNLSFELCIPNADSWTARIFIDGDEIPFEPKNLEDAANPGVYTLRTNITMETRIGFTKPVPKINTQGIVTGSIQT